MKKILLTIGACVAFNYAMTKLSKDMQHKEFIQSLRNSVAYEREYGLLRNT